MQAYWSSCTTFGIILRVGILLLYYAMMSIVLDKQTYNCIVIFTSIFCIPRLRPPPRTDIFHTTAVCTLKILYFFRYSTFWISLARKLFLHVRGRGCPTMGISPTRMYCKKPCVIHLQLYFKHFFGYFQFCKVVLFLSIEIIGLKEKFVQ